VSHRDESSFIVHEILTRLDAAGHLLPNVTDRIASDVHRVAKSPSEAAGLVFQHLAGPGRRYLARQDLFDSLSTGAEMTRFVIANMPIRKGAQDAVFNEQAASLAELDPARQAERLAELLERRENRDWHQSPAALPYSERRCRDMLTVLSPWINSGIDLDALAQKFAGSITGVDDQAAVRSLAVKLNSRGYARQEIDEFQAYRDYQDATGEDASAVDDGLRSLYADRGTTI
jgi:hypothetical protein